MKRELKIGLITESNMLPAWVVAVVERIVSLSYVQLSLVIRAAPATPGADPFLYLLYKARTSRPLNTPDAFELKDAGALLSGATVVQDDANEAMSAAAGLDVLINFSRHQLSDVYKECARYGVWRPFFSETRNTEVPGVWEVLERRPVTISGVEALDAAGNEKVIYQSVALTNPYSIRESRNSYYWKSVSFIPRLLEVLRADEGAFSEINIRPFTSVKPLKKYLAAPSDLSVLDAFVNPMPRRISTWVKNRSLKRDWMLMHDADSYVGKPFAAADFKQLLPPPGFFWADPIAVEKEGRHYIFLEEYVYAEGKGRISVIEVDENGALSGATPVLECPYHLSYPFVFEKDGKHYMIPETSDNQTIDLYECTEFPNKWTFKKNLLSGIRAVDSTVLFHNNAWWLFANVKEHEGASYLDELFLFYTDDIISSELKHHPKNPIVSDVRSARPAGPLYFKDGALFRPSQICAPYYGWGVSVNKVTKLTELEYEEQQITVITPDPHHKISGIHTLSYAGTFCVVDALTDMKK